MLGAIGQYGSNRNTIGVDKTGHIKTKWYVYYDGKQDRIDMFYKQLFLADMNILTDSCQCILQGCWLILVYRRGGKWIDSFLITHTSTLNVDLYIRLTTHTLDI